MRKLHSAIGFEHEFDQIIFLDGACRLHATRTQNGTQIRNALAAQLVALITHYRKSSSNALLVA